MHNIINKQICIGVHPFVSDTLMTSSSRLLLYAVFVTLALEETIRAITKQAMRRWPGAFALLKET